MTLTADLNLFDLIDEESLVLTEEAPDKLKRAKFVQGVDVPQKNQQLTVKHTGGIGFDLRITPESVIKMADEVYTTLGFDGNQGVDYAVFSEIETVILAISFNRRFYQKNEKGELKLFCGTNDRRGAIGWGTGLPCETCPNNKKNITGDKKGSCSSQISILCYFPKLDYTAILEIGGMSYLSASELGNYISKLSTEYAKLPELRAKNPNLKKVNSFFFKTFLKAGPPTPVEGGKPVAKLEFKQLTPPYNWSEVLNTRETVLRCSQITKEMLEVWNQQYIDWNPNLGVPNRPEHSSTQLSGTSQPKQIETKQKTPPDGVIMDVPAQPVTQPISVEIGDDIPEF
jgi:hypothetical protein